MEFEKAQEIVKAVRPKLNNSQLLSAYALYKQATEGPCTLKKPSFFEFEAKAKWDEWSLLKEMSKEVALEKYIELADTFLVELGLSSLSLDLSAAVPAQREGLAVSTMLQKERKDDVGHEVTIFDMARSGDLEGLKKFEARDSLKDLVDSSGMTLLHWASDRSHLEVIQYLLANGCDVNARESEDFNTPLHLAYYADSGDLLCVRELLAAKGCDPTLMNSDGDSYNSLSLH